MTLNQIKNQLQYAVPEELYQIEKGQIVFFVPDGSIHPTTMSWIGEISQYLWMIDTDDEIAFNIVPTRNKVLMNTVAGRKPQDTGSPYQVMVCTYDTIAGLAAEYHGVEIGNIIEDAPKADDGTTTSVERNDIIEEVRRYDIDTEKLSSYLPAIVTINPENRPVKEPDNEPYCLNCPFMEEDSDYNLGYRLTKSEPGSLAEKKLIKKEETKLEELLLECSALGLELDIDRIQKKVKEKLEQDDRTNYQLIIKTEFFGDICKSCEIYVADGEKYKLNLTTIQKAVYLTFLSYKDGIKIRYGLNHGLREKMQKTYDRLPFEGKCDKDFGGITDSVAPSLKAQEATLRSYFTEIKKAVKKIVQNPLTAQEFFIVGTEETDSPFAVERSTDAIREQIRREFHIG